MDHHERQRYLMNSHHRIMRMDVRTGAGTAQEVKESEENFHHSEEKDNLRSNEAMNEDDNKVNRDSNEHISHESPEEIIFPIFTTFDVMRAEQPKAEGKPDWKGFRTLLRKLMEDVGLKIMPGHISDEPKMRVPEDFRQAHISDDIEMTKLVDFFQGHSSDVGVRISPKNIFEDIFFPVFTTIFEMGAEKPKVEGKTDWEVLRTGLKKLMEVAVAIISNKDNEYQESGEENIPSTISSTVDFIQGHTSDDGLSISQEDDCYNDSDEEIVQGHILGISEFTHDLNSDEIGILKAIDHSPPIVNSEILDHAFLDYLDKFKLLLHQHQQMLPYYASHMRPLVNTAAQNNRDDNNSYMHEVLVKALSDSLKAILKEI
uniref:Uncharacterized protein n=1 Tax=Musca domestica TaxID=7370 RepID=T1PK62_MUSDO